MTDLKNILLVLVLVSFILQPCLPKQLFASDAKFGVGLKVGANKLEGDWKSPRFNPTGSLVLSYYPIPYFSVGTEFSYSILRTTDDAIRVNPDAPQGPFVDSNLFQVSAMPIEMDFKFNFSPFTTINPFASLGFGGLWWNATYDGDTVVLNGKEQSDVSLVFKTSGGVEFNFDSGLGLVVGADFRYTSTDLLDQIDNGDLNDGITSVWAGLNYYFQTPDPEDLDKDNIPRSLDRDVYRPEDRNGIMDHDGKPEYGRLPQNQNAPKVVHYPVFRAEEGSDLRIKAVITSQKPIRTAIVLYRSQGQEDWKLTPLRNNDDMYYEAVIRGDNVTRAGLEYCVVAVDNELKGIGYSGLPKRPIQVQVDPSGKSWRIVSGIVAFLGWGAATYIVMRKQTF